MASIRGIYNLASLLLVACTCTDAFRPQRELQAVVKACTGDSITTSKGCTSCQALTPGKVPNAARTACYYCTNTNAINGGPGKIKYPLTSAGVCILATDPKNGCKGDSAAYAASTPCKSCQTITPGTVPNAARSACYYCTDANAISGGPGKIKYPLTSAGVCILATDPTNGCKLDSIAVPAATPCQSCQTITSGTVPNAARSQCYLCSDTRAVNGGPGKVKLPLNSTGTCVFPPVNCVGSWSAWSACSVTCGNGTQTSTYVITTPAANGGAACPFASGATKTQRCNLGPCPVNCSGDWSAWSDCSQPCGGGIQTSTYGIIVPAQNGGVDCPYDAGENRTLDCNSQDCAPAPADCIGNWSDWSDCSLPCGSGTQTSTYTISSPAQSGGAECPFASGDSRTQACNTDACTLTPTNCSGEWSDWGNCSLPCGNGTQTSTYTILSPAQNGGEVCPYASGHSRTQACNTDACAPGPSNCIGSWSDWTNCSKPCGNGTQMSTYTISSPAQNGGAECSFADSSNRTQACNVDACPVPTPSEDWFDLTTGLAGATVVNMSLGVPSIIVLRGGSFPVLLSKDASHTLMAAARVRAGRVVVANKEAYFDPCGSACSGPISQVLLNPLRWAAGAPRSGATKAIRVASGSFSNSWLQKYSQAALSLGFNLTYPTGASSVLVSNTSKLAGNADVYVTTVYTTYTDAQRADIAAFVRAGGGLLVGGQGWSFSGGISNLPGNLLLSAVGSVVSWTGDYGEWYPTSITYGTVPPSLVQYNADAAAAALLAHINGSSPLNSTGLKTVSDAVTYFIKMAPFDGRGASGDLASAALWASFNSSLSRAVDSQAATWVCGSVDSTNYLNKLAVVYISKRNMEGTPDMIKPVRCYDKFPGVPAAGAATVDTTVTVNATFAGNYTGPLPNRGGTKWLSTGLWAPAGQPVTITLDASVAAGLNLGSGNVLGVQVGSHADDISGKASWCRLPTGMLQRYWFKNGAGGNSVTATSGMGGLVYVLIQWNNAFGPLTFTVTGAVRAPFFFKGVTSEADWISTIRNYPAPFAEIGSDKWVMTLPSSAVANLSNPAAQMDKWDEVLDAIAGLAGHTTERPRAERIVLDCDIGGGWMHSGYPIMAYVSVAKTLVSLVESVGRHVDWQWGFFHELGHNHNLGGYNLPNMGEVIPNYFSVYVMERVMQAPRTSRDTFVQKYRQPPMDAYFATGTYPASIDTSTGLYCTMQLQESLYPRNYTAGWEWMKRVLRRYQELDGTPAVSTTDAKIQTWVIETSKAAGLNLVNFFKTWKFPVTADTESNVTALNLGAWDFDPKTPCNVTGVCAASCCLNDTAV